MTELETRNAKLETRSLRGRLRHDEPMARHTSWRVGGPARRFYEPADLDDLANFLQQLPGDEPLLWIGLGSNLLVRDGGLRGTVLMLHLTETSANVESMIGTLMMMGIVVSNSILLVDFANRMVEAGSSAERAVFEAGRRRVRPILMTALATILGLLPLALGFGEGNETMVPLARAVVGGLAVSTLMTLLVVPVMHALVLTGRGHVMDQAVGPDSSEEM